MKAKILDSVLKFTVCAEVSMLAVAGYAMIKVLLF